MVKAARIPLLTSISWGAAFLLYYGLLLCCSQLYGLTLSLSAALMLPGDATLFGNRRDIFLPTHILKILYTEGKLNYISGGNIPPCSVPLSYLVGHASLASVYLSLASMFLLDRLSQRLLVPPPRERISAVRSGGVQT